MTITVLLTVAGVVVIFVYKKEWSSVSRNTLNLCKWGKLLAETPLFSKIVAQTMGNIVSFSIRAQALRQYLCLIIICYSMGIEGRGKYNLWLLDYWFSMAKTSLTVLKGNIPRWNTNKVFLNIIKRLICKETLFSIAETWKGSTFRVWHIVYGSHL